MGDRLPLDTHTVYAYLPYPCICHSTIFDHVQSNGSRALWGSPRVQHAQPLRLHGTCSHVTRFRVCATVPAASKSRRERERERAREKS
jgi:hypothetical protein